MLLALVVIAPLTIMALLAIIAWSCCAINERDPRDDDEQAEWLREWAERNEP